MSVCQCWSAWNDSGQHCVSHAPQSIKAADCGSNMLNVFCVQLAGGVNTVVNGSHSEVCVGTYVVGLPGARTSTLAGVREGIVRRIFLVVFSL